MAGHRRRGLRHQLVQQSLELVPRREVAAPLPVDGFRASLVVDPSKGHIRRPCRATLLSTQLGSAVMHFPEKLLAGSLILRC